MRPLDPLPSIKLKLGVAIVVAVGVGSTAGAVGVRWGLPALLGPVIATALALLLVQLLARGMTSPLREMVSATKAMARGDYQRRVTATSRDEVGELARAFNVMATELAEVDRLRTDLVANVSHELRTPIGALRAQLENIVDGVQPADERTLRTMLAQAERLGRLVSQLLDLSRLEAGTLPLHRETFRVRDVLDAAAAELRLHAPHVEFVVDVSPSDLSVDADPERLHQVVFNLLENAARFSPPGRPVRLEAQPEAAAVRVAVVDQGPGIPEGDRERIFERFHRGDPARAVDGGGAGLGLAITKWIVELHGGRIRAEDIEPAGCRMVVTIPRSAA